MSGEVCKTWQELRDLEVERGRRDRAEPLTRNQGVYQAALGKATVTICVGPAGTGKTYLACAEAARSLRDGKVRKIIASRPLVSCSGRQGKGVGFLPGDLREKVTPYMRPLLDAFGDFFSPTELSRHLEKGGIEMLPLDLMRGMSIKGAFVICDEAQNAEFEQLYMLLTRIDKGTRLVVTGDDSSRQNDLRGESALREVRDRLSRRPHKDVALVRLGREDVVRHPLVRYFDEALSDDAPEVPHDGAGWLGAECHACHTRLWFDDEDEEVDQVKCYRCGACTDLWDDEDYYLPRAAAYEDDPAETYPEKP